MAESGDPLQGCEDRRPLQPSSAPRMPGRIDEHSQGVRQTSGRPPASSAGGAALFRASRRGGVIDDADTIDGAREIVRGRVSRRDDVDDIRAGPFLSGHASRSRGRMIRYLDGRVEEEPWP
jgi:hypothetical protein